jgi:hypothetical protein
MKYYRHNRHPFNSRWVKHIQARSNEWVCVHRSNPTTVSTSSCDDWLWPLVFKIGGSILLFVIICKIIAALMPFLVLGALGWFFLVTRR